VENPPVEYFEKDLARARENRDRPSEGIALLNMGIVLHERGDRKQAVEYAEAALVIHEELQSPHIAKLRELIETWRNG
jgi:tetratricopeptide (TPR) repeat protein